MDYHFKNLVFEGGGVKGTAYIGAMEVLEAKQILPQIKRVGGTSAGAINAVLIGLGYTVEEMGDLLSSLDFREFQDDTWGLGRDTFRLVKSFGWYKGDAFHAWISDKIAQKMDGNPNATFADIERHKVKRPNLRSLYLVGVNLSTSRTEVFSYETTPDMAIADATRISMSIPLFFTAKKYPNSEGEKDIYVDGGLLNNYPVRLFDQSKYLTEEKEQDQASALSDSSVGYVHNTQTLGFRLDTTIEISTLKKYGEPFANDYKLVLLALDRMEDLPSTHDSKTGNSYCKQITVAKINNFYHVRIFDDTGDILIDKGRDEFTPGQKLIDDLNQAIRMDQVDDGLRNQLKERVLSSLGRQEIDGFRDYIMILANNLFSAQQCSHLNNNDWSRTIYIDTLDVSTIDFGLDEAKKARLIEQGRKGTEKFFNWYDNRTLT